MSANNTFKTSINKLQASCQPKSKEEILSSLGQYVELIPNTPEAAKDLNLELYILICLTFAEDDSVQEYWIPRNTARMYTDEEVLETYNKFVAKKKEIETTNKPPKDTYLFPRLETGFTKDVILIEKCKASGPSISETIFTASI